MAINNSKATAKSTGNNSTSMSYNTSIQFLHRQLEYTNKELEAMLKEVNAKSIEDLMTSAIPNQVVKDIDATIRIPEPLSEQKVLELAKVIASKNTVFTSLIGQGYHNTLMPSVIKRNVFENPGWYTSYTAYQAEISQGRLEALFNFQTMTSELTGLPIANASLLDEGTALAEAVLMAHRFHKDERSKVIIVDSLHPQSLEVIHTRSSILGIELVQCTAEKLPSFDNVAAIVLQLPTTRGDVFSIKEIAQKAKVAGALVIAALDPMFLVLAGKPSEWGIDIAVGSFQRFGIPMGFGGPHAAYFATTEALKRIVPGRIVGMSKDSNGRDAYRFALQTREQHIRREKATSNICTSQVFLAVLSSMYAVYHGPKGLRAIATKIYRYTHSFYNNLKKAGIEPLNNNYFDTISWRPTETLQNLVKKFLNAGYNIRVVDNNTVSITFDESTTIKNFEAIATILDISKELSSEDITLSLGIPQTLLRKDTLLSQSVFNRYHTETEMMRYLRRLMDKDLALDRTMIPLGSCTMKLNAATELMPLSFDAFANIHPFAPLDQSYGYQTIITQLEKYLCSITGYDSVSLQPNAGSQGEYAGLLAIIAYHKSRGEGHRNICLIPSSAHGTNPASAKMANLEVVIVNCDKKGNIDIEDLTQKAVLHTKNLAAIMITYPSTHGVYEAHIKELCAIVHKHGGQVYIDGANFNALVGYIPIAKLGADVSHLNLHKTFAIPHGGGGPGVGPIGVRSHLAPFLPYNMLKNTNNSITAKTTSNINGKTADKSEKYTVGAVSSAPWGSSLVLIISWMYIRLMGAEGLKYATAKAVLNANYIASRLKNHFSMLYKGQNERVAHECIIDLRDFKAQGIEAEDVAKRLIDYGFHAPTMSWPVAGTLMVEPTESESKFELDRFCDAMINIRKEIDKVSAGIWTKEDNPLVHAPHSAIDICADKWTHSYSRKIAAYPFLPDGKSNPQQELELIQNKYWSPVSRIDNAYGDKNLICSCPPLI